MPLAKLREAFRQFGAFDGSLYLVHRALERTTGGRAGIHRYYLVAQPVPDTSALRNGANGSVCILPPDDPLRTEFPRPAHVIAKRYHDGNLCFGARVSQRFAGFLWIARESYDEDEVRCLYHLADPASSVWDYDVYVEPQFRLGRTFARLWDAANRHLAADGVRWTFSRISGFNPVSLQVHSKLGVRRLFGVTFLRAGTVQLTLAGAPPFVHLSLSPRSRPTLKLSPPECDLPANSWQESSRPTR